MSITYFLFLVSHQNSLNHSGKTRTTSSFPKESNATKSVPALTPPKIAIQVPEKLSDKLSNEKLNMLISRMEQKNDENLPKLAHNISNQQLISCDLCENYFSSEGMLVSHKKISKSTYLKRNKEIFIFKYLRKSTLKLENTYYLDIC